MPFFKSKTDLSILRTRPVSLTDSVLNPLREALLKLRHTGIFHTGVKEVSGLMPLLDADKGEFEDPNLWLTNDRHLVALAFRVDKKRVPPDLLRREVDKLCSAWCADRDVERTPAAIRKEFKERVENDLLSKALPVTSTTGIVWHPVKGEIWVDSVSESRLEAIRKLLHRLGVTAYPMSPLDAISSSSDLETLISSTPTSMTRVGTDTDVVFREDITPAPPHLAHAFLVWLWQRSMSDSTFKLPSMGEASVWVDARMGFRKPDGEKVTTLLTSENCYISPEARASLRAGDVLHELKICVKRDDREYGVTLVGSMLRRKGASTPAVASESMMEALYDHVLTLEDLEGVLRDLYSTFSAFLLERGVRYMQDETAAWLDGLE